QEAIARMHGLRARRLARLDDAVAAQVRIARRRSADAHRLVGELDVACVAIGLGEHRDGGDAHAPRGLDHAASDFAAVGDEDLAEHGYSGIFPCLRHGLSSFLSRSIARLRQMRRRVSCGMMTSSMKPRRPAMNGLANFSRYSVSRAAILAASFF